jgi:hypothetical protein
MSLMDEWLEKAKADAAEKAKVEKAARPKGQKCSNCKFHRGHEFSPKYHYCRLGKSPHTPNGYAKTKAGGWCAKWEGRDA